MKKILIILAIFILIFINKEDKDIIIPNNAIRFRVVANSNKIEDQNNKLLVSNFMQEEVYKITKQSKTDEEAMNSLLNNYESLNKSLQTFLQSHNIKSSYNISIGNNYFPKKNYKGVNYQAGHYNSVVVELGNHQGLNWWCVIYPPLCLIDENKDEIEYKSFVKEILNQYQM